MAAVLHFCCGCSLRTGTLILLTFGLVPVSLTMVYGTLAALSQDAPPAATLIFFLLTGGFTFIHAAGIYGVLKEKPSFLKPYLGFQAFLMAVVIIYMVVLALYVAGLMAEKVKHDFESVIKFTYAAGTIGFEMMLLFVEVIFFYFFAVVLSFYKELRSKTQSRNSSLHLHCDPSSVPHI